MRSLLVVALALALIVAAAAVDLDPRANIVCPKDACLRVHCPLDRGAEECASRGTPGQYKYFLNSGFCGCCHECAKMRQENEHCLEVPVHGGTHPHHQVCADGLICDNVSFKCVKKSNQ